LKGLSMSGCTNIGDAAIRLHKVSNASCSSVLKFHGVSFLVRLCRGQAIDEKSLMNL
jgi:hypothetical protein